MKKFQAELIEMNQEREFEKVKIELNAALKEFENTSNKNLDLSTFLCLYDCFQYLSVIVFIGF
jgi:hypothetical protein